MHFFYSTPAVGIIYVHVLLNWQQNLNKKIRYNAENTFVFHKYLQIQRVRAVH